MKRRFARRPARRVVLGVALVLPWLALPRCTPPPHGTGDCTAELPRPAAHLTTASRVVAEADIVIAVEGREYRLRADLSWTSGGTFIADFYSLFGSSVLSVTSDRAGGEIAAEGTTYRFNADDRIGEIGGFYQLPFTFCDFIRILQGTYVAATAQRARLDTVTSERRRVHAELLTDSLRIHVTKKGGACRTERVVYEGPGEEGWLLVFEEFRDGLPTRTEFRSERNYFVLKHRIVRSAEE